MDARDYGRGREDAALDLGGEGEVLLVVVALFTDFGGEGGALTGDRRNEEADDEVSGKADEGSNDSDVYGFFGRAEEVLQVGAEEGEADGDGEAIDKAAQGDREDVEIAKGIVFYDDPVGIGDGGDGDGEDEVEQARGAALFEEELAVVFAGVLLPPCHAEFAPGSVWVDVAMVQGMGRRGLQR